MVAQINGHDIEVKPVDWRTWDSIPSDVKDIVGIPVFYNGKGQVWPKPDPQVHLRIVE